MLAVIAVESTAPAFNSVLENVAELADRRRSTWGRKFLRAAVILSNYPCRITFFGPMKEDYKPFVVESPAKKSGSIDMLAFPHVLSREGVVGLSFDALLPVTASQDYTMWGIIFEVMRRCREIEPQTYLVTRWVSDLLEKTETELLEKCGEDFAVGLSAWFFKRKQPISRRYFCHFPPFPPHIPGSLEFTIFGSDQLKTATRVKRLIEDAETGFEYDERGRLVNDLIENGMILGKTDRHTLLFYAPTRPYEEIAEYISKKLEDRPCLICGSPVRTRVRRVRICGLKPCQGRFDRLKQKARELYDQGITGYTDLCRALHESHIKGQEYLKQKGRVNETWQAYDLKRLIKFTVLTVISERKKEQE
ncbi:hypothetical protein [Thermodesulforhabdus norvegica]|nr:hypothetical protein [Thermodesulforhabdus norvegica]